MQNSFFGQYLLSKGLINSTQLKDALAAQEKTNKKLGELAVDAKLLTDDQVLEILALQKKSGVFFGEGAQKLGYLTKEQVDDLLQKQKKQHVWLGEVLVTMGFISKEQRDKNLDEFTAEQSTRRKTQSEFSFPKELEEERSFIEKFRAHTLRVLQRMSGIVAKFERYEQVENEMVLPEFAALVDHSNSKGQKAIRFLILLDEAIAEILHAKICEHNSINENSISRNESLKEMLNIFSYTGFQIFAKLNASVPQILNPKSKYIREPKECSIMVSLVTPYGPIKFLLSFFQENIKLA